MSETKIYREAGLQKKKAKAEVLEYEVAVVSVVARSQWSQEEEVAIVADVAGLKWEKG